MLLLVSVPVWTILGLEYVEGMAWASEMRLVRNLLMCVLLAGSIFLNTPYSKLIYQCGTWVYPATGSMYFFDFVQMRFS